jgi:glutamate/tyrosine decarboxylase-like PLP-dependent enzyme
MFSETMPRTASTLDPPDWEDLRRHLHEAADHLLDHVRDCREGPVWREMPPEVAEELLDPITGQGAGTGRAWELLRQRILPYGVGNLHPRFMGWVHGAGTPGGLLVGLAEAAMNANVGGRNTGALNLERSVIAWSRDLFGLPQDSTGVLTSGTSMATVVALAAARRAHAEWDVEEEGLGSEGARFRLYASEATHNCVPKALRLLGFGRRALRTIPTDGGGRMRLDLLRQAIRDDTEQGLRPWAVVGNAGTVDRGVVDDLHGIADVAADEGIWFHVDGAFGALLRLSPAYRDRVEGIHRADSLAFDYHKWLHVTYDCGCVLIRDGEAHMGAFGGRPEYLEGHEAGLAAGAPWPSDHGPELSRGFRALKVWFLLVEHGTDALAEAIEGSVDRAQYLAERIEWEPLLELAAPVDLNVACFRVSPGPDEDGDDLNRAVVTELQERGIAAPSTTRVGSDLVIRCCIMNHRTTHEDVDTLVDGVLSIAAEMRR